MILFLGDSFTWGQGLFLHKWHEDGSISKKEYKIPPKYNHELISYEDDEYRKQHHFPSLVSKHFGKSYCTIWGNGGSNKNIISILKNLDSQFYSGVQQTIDLFVIQFTCPTRSFDDVSDEAMENEIRELDEIISSYNKKWIGITWRPEHGNILENKFQENFIKLVYNQKSYNNFEEILYCDNNEFTLDRYFTNSINDGHFSKKGHEFIANSIIKKIENSHIY